MFKRSRVASYATQRDLLKFKQFPALIDCLSLILRMYGAVKLYFVGEPWASSFNFFIINSHLSFESFIQQIF